MTNKSKSLLLSVGVASAIGLTSCVITDDGYGPTTSTVYRPGYSLGLLPRGYRSEVIAGRTYYYHDGNYYRRASNGYTVVDAPRRSRYYNEYSRHGNRVYHNHPDGTSHVVSQLPRGYTTVRHHGQPYYRYGNQYYRRQGSGYLRVSSPF